MVQSALELFLHHPLSNEITDNFFVQRSWWWRGKVIGGTGAINTMIYMRGNRKDYDNWAAQGNHGWAYQDVLPYFKKLEQMRDPKLASGKFIKIKFFSTNLEMYHAGQVTCAYSLFTVRWCHF